MARLFDIRYGGFGTAPKFPHPAACEFLLARWHDTREDWIREVVEKTLTAMARGGIRDHVGGGFHRYAVDERWIVPHFEKMAYDNAELLHAFLSGYAALGTPLFKEVAQGIVDWVLAVLADRERGAFYTSQDADTGFGDDGDYWTWTPEEARAALSEREFAVAARVFDIQDAGEMHHNPKKNVLWWRQSPAGDDEWPILKDALRKLAAARGRHQPLLGPRSLGRPSGRRGRFLRHRTGPGRSRLSRHAGQARAGLPDPIGEWRRGACARPAVGVDRRRGVAPAARPPAGIVRRRSRGALALRSHAAARDRIGAQPRDAHRGGGSARSGSGVRDAPRRPAGLPAAQSRGAQDGRPTGRHRVRRHHLLAARRDSRGASRSAAVKARVLGRTGLRVGELGFGAWAIGGNQYGNAYGPA